MKLCDIIKILDSDEFYVTCGEKIECVRLYDGDDLNEYMEKEVERVRPYNGGFEIDLVD